MEPKASSKSYEAFRVQPAIETLPGNQRVESLCCWNGDLLVGLQDGTVVHFSAQPGTRAWQVVRGHRSLERKAVMQMAAVQLRKRPLLLTLTEDGVNLLTLPDMKLKYQPMGSRGASLFAWNEEAQLLAVAVRRRVILYQLHGSELRDAGERTAPDVVAAMMWVGGGLLLVGMRRQYVLLNTTSGAVTEIGATGSAPHPLALLCPSGQEMLLVRDSSTYYHSTADGRYSRRRHLAWSAPLLALAAAGQYAVAVTTSGLEVRSLRRVAEGHVVQRVPLVEPQRPVPPAVSDDGAVFVVAATGTATTSASASAVGSQASAAAGGGAVIFRLVPVPLEEQARTLAEMGEYSEALALAELVGDEEEAVKEELDSRIEKPEQEAPGATRDGRGQRWERQPEAEGIATSGGGAGAGSGSGSGGRALLEERLRLAYGHYLFKSGEYDEGMAQLALCKSTTALVLLRLFPSLVPPKSQRHLPTHAAGQPLPLVSEPTGEAYGTAVSQLLPYILSHRTRAMNALAEADAAAAAASLAPEMGSAAGARDQKHVSPQAAQGATGLREQAKGIDEPERGERNRGARGQGHEALPANGTSHPAAAAWIGGSFGTAASAAASDSRGELAAGAAANGDAGDRERDGAGAPTCPPLPPQELLVILDTAIVRIMVVLPDTGALLRFVQLPNYVDLQEGEKALEESGMYAELAALYKCNGCHEKGLELLRKLSQEPGTLPRPARGAAADLPGLPGVWAAVRYLVSLSAADAAAIQRHAGWILAADVEAGLSALLHMRPPLDPSQALSILNRHSAHYCGLYLETALQIGVALPQDYHNELLLIYLRDILAKEPLSLGRASNHSGDELKELLLSHRPDPDQPPLLFPEDLAHALLNNPKAAKAAAARRFASAPASSAGTPVAMSRVGSRSSVQSGAAAAPAAARQPGHAPAALPAQPVRSGQMSAASTEEMGTSSGSEEEEEEGEKQKEDGVPAGSWEPSPEPTSVKPPKPAATGRQQQQQQQQTPRAPPFAPDGRGAAAAAATTEAELRPQGLESKARRHANAQQRQEKQRPDTAGASDVERPPPQRPRRPRRSSADTLVSSTGKAPPQPAGGAAGSGASALREPPAGGGVGAPASTSAAAAAAGPSLYQRLRDLVYTSPYIDPGYVLDKLPQGELLEIRALMLERLGSHREALRLYVHALGDLAAAEAYCDRVHSAAVAAACGGRGRGLGALDAGVLGDPAQPGDIYLELVRALYDGPESCPSAKAVAEAAGGPAGGGGGGGGGLVPWAAAMPLSRGGSGGVAGGTRLDPATWQALSRLLSRKRERLDPLQVLGLLPDDVAVADVLPWLAGALRFTMEARRNLAVLRQLRRSENLAALEEAVRLRQQPLVITSERACSLCHKRLGNAAFVSYPGGLLAHYSCHMRHTGDVGGGVDAAAAGRSGGAGGGGVEVGVVEVHHPQHHPHHGQHGQHGLARGGPRASGGGAEVAAWA